MPVKMGWLDENLHIYEAVLCDPFTSDDQDQFFDELCKLMIDGHAPLFGLVDISKCTRHVSVLSNPRLKELMYHRGKLVAVVVVTKDVVSAALSRWGAAMASCGDRIHVEQTREAAIRYLEVRARSN